MNNTQERGKKERKRKEDDELNYHYMGDRKIGE
jgi:hypothetical protein